MNSKIVFFLFTAALQSRLHLGCPFCGQHRRFTPKSVFTEVSCILILVGLHKQFVFAMAQPVYDAEAAHRDFTAETRRALGFSAFGSNTFISLSTDEERALPRQIVVSRACRRVEAEPSPNDLHLISAAAKGDVIAVSMMMRRPDVNPAAADNEALIAAVRNGNRGTVWHLLADSGVDPNARGGLPLVTASAAGRKDVVQEFLTSLHIDLTAGNSGSIALAQAAGHGHDDVVELLLGDCRIDAAAGNCAAAVAAARNGRVYVLHRILAHCASPPPSCKRCTSADASAAGPSAPDSASGSAASGSAAPGSAAPVDLTHSPIELVKAALEELLASGRMAAAARQYLLVWSATHGYEGLLAMLLADPLVDPNAAVAIGCHHPSDAADPRVQPAQLLVRATGYSGKRRAQDRRIAGVPATNKLHAAVQHSAALTAAAAAGHVALVARLLADARVDPAARHQQALIEACATGQAACVDMLLAHPRVDPSARGGEPLLWAAFGGNLSIIERLLADARVNAAARNSGALVAAAGKGHVDVVARLLADPRVKPTARYCGAYLAAAAHGHAAAMDLLQPASSAAAAPARLNECLIQAAAGGHISTVERLLADPRVDPRADASAALIAAAREGHLPVLERLLADGRADPAQRSNAAVRLAATAGHAAVLGRLLADPRVDPSAKPQYQRPTLLLAVRSGSADTVARLLADPRIDPLAKGNNESLIQAAELGHAAVVDRLLADGRLSPASLDHAAVRDAAGNERVAVLERLLADPRTDAGEFEDLHAIRAHVSAQPPRHASTCSATTAKAAAGKAPSKPCPAGPCDCHPPEERDDEILAHSYSCVCGLTAPVNSLPGSNCETCESLLDVENKLAEASSDAKPARCRELLTQAARSGNVAAVERLLAEPTADVVAALRVLASCICPCTAQLAALDLLLADPRAAHVRCDPAARSFPSGRWPTKRSRDAWSTSEGSGGGSDDGYGEPDEAVHEDDEYVDVSDDDTAAGAADSVDLNACLRAACGVGHTAIAFHLLDRPDVRPEAEYIDFVDGSHDIHRLVHTALSRACRSGSDHLDCPPEIVVRLLSDPRVKASSTAGRTAALRYTATRGLAGPLAGLLTDRASVLRPKALNSALCAAAEHGHLACVQRLLQHRGVDPAARNNAAVAAAVDNGHAAVVEALLNDSRVKLPGAAEGELGSLAELASQGNVSLLKHVLGDRRRRIRPMDEFAALISAAGSGAIRSLRLMLGFGQMDPSNSDSHALFVASEVGDEEIIRLLLTDSRVDPTAQGNAALMSACHRGKFAAAQLLLDHPRVRAALASSRVASARSSAGSGGRAAGVSVTAAGTGAKTGVGKPAAAAASIDTSSVGRTEATVQRLLREAALNPVVLLEAALRRGGPPSVIADLVAEVRLQTGCASAAPSPAAKQKFFLALRDSRVIQANLWESTRRVLRVSPYVLRTWLWLIDALPGRHIGRFVAGCAPAPVTIHAVAWTRRRHAVLSRAAALAESESAESPEPGAGMCGICGSSGSGSSST